MALSLVVGSALMSSAAAHDGDGAEASPTRSAAAVMDPRTHDAAASSARLALLVAAEAALARGDAPSAVASLDRAAMMLHSADTEMGLVRAYLQQGEYRRALAFAAHTAGAHRDTPSASALYAWLLSLGGQGVYAQRVLDQAPSAEAADAVVAATRTLLAMPGAAPTQALLRTPHRMAPYGVSLQGAAPLPSNAHVVASGLLLRDGRHALVPLGSVDGAQSARWVRDGLGRTRSVTVERRMEVAGLALVTFEQPLDGADSRPARRDPFAGSPGYAVAFATSGDATPAWPWLYPGFVGNTVARLAEPGLLSFDVPASVEGAALFDATGAWSGIVLAQGAGGHAVVTAARLRDELGSALLDDASATDPAPRMSADAIDERAMHIALQVIATP
jgi:hypothetical protein